MLGFHETPLVRASICDKHGEYQSKCYMRNIWTDCPVCQKEAKAAKEQEDAEKESKRRQAAWEKRMGEAGIPERFRSKTLASYQAASHGQHEVLAFAAQYAAEWVDVSKTGRCALFIGKPGTGKTHIAVGIGLSVMQKHGATVLFTSVSKMLRRIKDTYRKGATESERSVMAFFTECDLLIMDEVGVQFGTEYEKNTLFDVINERYESLKPTILMSNLSIAEIKNYLGERAFDRLRENGGQSLVFGWDSYRGAA